MPGAALRDHMILYQDFYNANELFAYLAENSVFLGGEIGNPDSWFVPPSFFKRYWFLCPNHKHDRTDNSVESMANLGQSMIQFMTSRKQMYIERDLHSEHFPTPTTVEQAVQHVVDQAFLQKNDQHYLNAIYNTPTMDDIFSIKNNGHQDILASNLPLGKMGMLYIKKISKINFVFIRGVDSHDRRKDELMYAHTQIYPFYFHNKIIIMQAPLNVYMNHVVCVCVCV